MDAPRAGQPGAAAPGIVLYQVPGAWGLPSVSPFCVKLQTWLRIAGLPYEVRLADPMRSPKGKVPYIEHEGRRMGDSQLIQAHLARVYGLTLDDHLSAEERARAHAVRRMLEEGTYWVLAHDRWVVDANFAHYRPVFLGFLPPVIGRLILPMIRRDMRAALRTQGTGRHTPDEIDTFGVADVDALAALLGDRPWFCGESPTSVDAAVYASVASVLAFPGESRTKAAMAGHANLVAYRARVEARFWATQSRPGN